MVVSYATSPQGGLPAGGFVWVSGGSGCLVYYASLRSRPAQLTDPGRCRRALSALSALGGSPEPTRRALSAHHASDHCCAGQTHGRRPDQVHCRPAHLRAAELTALFRRSRPTVPQVATCHRLFGDALDRARSPNRGRGAPPRHGGPNRAAFLLLLDGKTMRGTIPHEQTWGVHWKSARHGEQSAEGQQ